MWKRFCRYILCKRLGWTIDVSVDHPNKYIICLAPHTSNWDFILGQLYAGSQGWRINFLMKKEWFFGPLGPIFRAMGGIPVERSEKHNLTQQLSDAAIKAKVFHLCITPEGTRKRTTEWKKGFYHIAETTQIPILLYGIDYEKRLIKCSKSILPSGNATADIAEIMEYYKNFKGKHPDNFVVEKV